MQLTPDEIIVFTLAGWEVNATLVNTWIVMALLVGISMLIPAIFGRMCHPIAGAPLWKSS